MNHRRGFTLIEVMIVAAVGVILLAAVFSVNFRITDLWGSERGRQELQQNFRFAADYITTDLRQAVAVRQPAQNAFGDVLAFDVIVTPAPSETRQRIIYQRVGVGPYRIERREIQVVDPDHDGVWTESGTATTSSVTEEIRTLAALHFMHRGSRVVCILVAEYVAGGANRTISYTTQTSVRVPAGRP